MNVDSAFAVLTQDRVRRVDGGFELLGRAPGAPPRGCSIALDEMLSAAGGRAVSRTRRRARARRPATARRGARRLRPSGRGIAPRDRRARPGSRARGSSSGSSRLERDATRRGARALWWTAAGDAEHVHVVLSANVFVAPLRAIAHRARGCASASRCDRRRAIPSLAAALVERAAAGDGRSRSSRARRRARRGRRGPRVRARRDHRRRARRVASGRRVRGHGAGMGVALVSPGADLRAAADSAGRSTSSPSISGAA